MTPALPSAEPDHDPCVRSYDAVVVGLGAAGCETVSVLTAHGMTVAGLDAGGFLSPRDLPAELEPSPLWRRWSLRRFVQSRSVSFHPRLEHLYVDDRDHPYATRGGDPFLWIRGRQIGGRLHTWARMALRLSDADLQRAAVDGQGACWPLRYADLEPYYDAVEDRHRLRGARDGLPGLPDGKVAQRAELRPAARQFRQRVEGRWPERPVIAPRTFERDADPRPLGLRDALATGKLTVVADAPVARVLLDQSGRRAIGVEFVDRTRRRVIRGDRVFLCASAIESVRILLASHSAAHPAGIGNRHDQLGRHVLDHNFVVGTGPTPDEYRDAIADDDGRVPCSPLDLGSELDFYMPDFSATLHDRDFVRGFAIQGRISRDTWGMGVFGEMLPHPDNRVTLARRKDAHGLPTVNIRVARRANDRAMIDAQKRELRAIAAAAGLPIRMPVPAPLRRLLWRAVGPEVGVMHLGIAIHEAGGARMGADPERSVLDSHNRVWGVPNVWVVDGACLPNTGCQNPTLTIMAIAARAATLAAIDGG